MFELFGTEDHIDKDTTLISENKKNKSALLHSDFDTLTAIS